MSFRLLVLGTVWFGFLGGNALAQVDATIQRTTIAPTIDGLGDDAIWAFATAHGQDEFNNVEGSPPDGPADLTVTWRALWDTNNLYVLAEVVDDVIRTDSADDWQDDGVEIYIDAQDLNLDNYEPGGANPGQPVYQFTALAGFTPQDAADHTGRPLSTSSFVAGTNSYGGSSPPNHYDQGADTSTAVQSDDNHWSFEVAFPWTALEETPADILARGGFGFGVAYNDNDTGVRDSQAMWASTQNNLWNSSAVFPTAALSDVPVGGNPLTLEVNTDTGVATIKNGNADFPLQLEAYTVTSESGSLNPTGWNSLDDQNIDAIDVDGSGTAGDSLGEGWDESVAEPNRLAENFLRSETEVAAATGIEIGSIFGSAPLEADFDLNGAVDGDDFLAWQGGFGSPGGREEGDADGNGVVDGDDFLIWQNQFGEVGGGPGVQDFFFKYSSGNGVEIDGAVEYVSGGQGSAIPEPASIGLLALAIMSLAFGRPALRRFSVRCLAVAAAVTLVALPAQAVLVHQYTFNDGNANDLVGGQNGTLVDPSGIAGYQFGQLNLSANNGATSSDPSNGAYVDLPNGLVSNISSGFEELMSVEIFATIDENRNWARLFDSGTSDGGEDVSGTADNQDFFAWMPQSGSSTYRLELSDRASGGGGVNIEGGPPPSVGVEHHFVAVYDGPNALATLYLDGAEAGSGAPSVDFFLANLDDNNNWLGRAQWGDPLFDGLYNEVNFYNHALSATEVADNFAAGPVTFPGPLPQLVVDRDSGVIEIENTGSGPLDLKAYDLVSAFGGLDPDGWTPQLDEITASLNENLAEQSNTMVTIGAGESLNLGPAWIRSPTEDVAVTLTLGDDSMASLQVAFNGNAGVPFARSDLDFDGDIDIDDYAIYLGGQWDDLSGMSLAEAYGVGDLNGDLVNDFADFGLFKADFDNANGAGSFGALFGVPEPSSVLLLTLAGLALMLRQRRLGS